MSTTTTHPEVMLVRIHEPKPTKGYHARTYLLSGSPYPKFEWQKGWYEVDYATAQRLKNLRNNPQDPHSRPVFQVVTREEAMALEDAEKEVVAEADSPISLPKKVAAKIKDEDTSIEGWEDGDDEIPEDDETPKGPVETADPEDLAEIEELERAAEEAEKEAEAPAPKKTAKKTAKKKKAVAKRKAPTKPKPRRKASTKRTRG